MKGEAELAKEGESPSPRSSSAATKILAADGFLEAFAAAGAEAVVRVRVADVIEMDAVHVIIADHFEHRIFFQLLVFGVGRAEPQLLLAGGTGLQVRSCRRTLYHRAGGGGPVAATAGYLASRHGSQSLRGGGPGRFAGRGPGRVGRREQSRRTP